jgi:hypothetical protein
LISTDPAIGFWAPATGDYYVRVGTTATTTSYARSYDLHMERVGPDNAKSNESLDQAGAFRTWLTQDGRMLHITGPSGYGFSLRGNWITSVSGTSVTYSTNSTMYLSTPFLQEKIGDLALQPSAGGFSVTADAPIGWRALGKLAGSSGELGFSLAPVANAVRQASGLNVSQIGVMSKWKIMTGGAVTSHFRHLGIDQVLEGVPYLVYQGGDGGRVVAEFGDLRLNTGTSDQTVMIAEPADPYLYLFHATDDSDQFAAGASFNGRIPFNNTVGPTTSITSTTPAKYFGHVLADVEVEKVIMGIPFIFNGDLTLDLDANDDGVLVGGVKGSDLFRSGAAWGELLGDMNIGHNGEVSLGSGMIRANIANGCAVYDGAKGGVWFKGEQHNADVWEGTPLEDFKTGESHQVQVEGHVLRGGVFSITNRGKYAVHGLGEDLFKSELTLVVGSSGTVASTYILGYGSVTTPIGKADVYGSIEMDGDFAWGGSMDIDIGSSDNYLRANATVDFTKEGSKWTFSASGEMDARLSIPGVRVDVDLRGHLDLIYTPSGLDFDAGFSADFDLEVYAPVFGWQDVVEFGGDISVNNDRLKVIVDTNIGSYGFTLNW